MKIIATSDWHGNLPVLPKCDLLLVVGDICPDYHDNRVWNQGAWFERQAVPYMQAIAPETLIVWGNHDFYGEGCLEREYGGRGHRVTVLQDSGALVHGGEEEGLTPLYIWGMPWIKNLPMWAFSLDENQFRAKMAKIPLSTDILLSHGPPLYWGDQLGSNSKYGSRWDGEHVGWYELRAWLEQQQERSPIVLCGHIHEAFGHYRDKRVNNVSYVDENYTPKERWLELIYDKEGLRVDRIGYSGGSGDGAAGGEGGGGTDFASTDA